MKTLLRTAALFLMFSLLLPAVALSHCEIPCGIYDDRTRITLLNEHIATIEKSMDQIVSLSAEGDKNYNQLVRWVTNKEDHADKFMEIVTQYFMTQRIKPADPSDNESFDRYQESLRLLHEMLVHAMKCKQTTDKAHTAKLSELVDKFANLYFEQQ
ncbi:MAG: superoxide dismutase [Candidatus Zixiibacteriota bacterium]|nr:MAG: superoxide dismutase [candidate division Zixibacteria bacterium]